MIQSGIVNNSFTEIYAGGGKCLTENFPTNFHSFFSKKRLHAGDSIDNYREVAPQERAAIEASDAGWVRPPQCFIDLWNAICGEYGRYNEATGFFELNGLTDITYGQAMAIYQAGRPNNPNGTLSIYSGSAIRTNLPWLKVINGGCGESFFGCGALEVAHVYRMTTVTQPYPFYACGKLHTVIGTVQFNLTDGFSQCSRLVSVKARQGKSGATLLLGGCPQLDIDSVKYSVENSQPCTIQVHPDVYAKLTGDTTNAAAASLSGEELAQWMAIAETAAEKNIILATT